MPLVALALSVRQSLRTLIAIPLDGGCTFAEHPCVAAPDARIIWHALLDPGVLVVDAVPARLSDPDGLDPGKLRRWLVTARDAAGVEHAVLSDGRRHIRLDVRSGSLLGEDRVLLRYDLAGIERLDAPVLTLRRLIHLCRHDRFPASLFPADRRIDRWIRMLRVADARRAGASHREIAEQLADDRRIAAQWREPSDALRSEIRRLVADARHMVAGGFWSLMHRDAGQRRAHPLRYATAVNDAL